MKAPAARESENVGLACLVSVEGGGPWAKTHEVGFREWVGKTLKQNKS